MGPENRSEYQAYCLRRLGAPVLQINLDQTQIDDRTDDALRYFWEYHFDGTEKTYYKYAITAEDIANRYILLPENIIGAVRIFDLGIIGGDSNGVENPFNLNYQIALNDLYALSSTTLVPYFMAMQHLELMQQLLVGQKPIRFNRHKHKLHIDMDWRAYPVGFYLVVEAFKVVDPDDYIETWSNRWLLEYGTQLMKRQWGENLKKMTIQLPGGVIMNGQQIWNEAEEKIVKMEAEFLEKYSEPMGLIVA